MGGPWEVVVWGVFLGVLGFTGGSVMIGGAPGYPRINVSISDFNASDTNGWAFSNQVQLKANTISVIDVVNIAPVVSFMIVQVHTQEWNITLSYTASFDNKILVTGSNVGLQIDPKGHQVFVKNDNDAGLQALVAVVVYSGNAPIPGGCNMEFSIETSPFLRTSVGNSMIMVDAQPASSIGPNGNQLPCEKNFVTYETYRLYIPERDFTSETYFATMSRMLTVDNIIKFGKRVPPAVSTSQMRRVFSAYPGTGSVYAMIARYKNSSVAYVPAFSYACSPLSNPESCSLLNTTISKVICATILFVGFFLTFIGHVWFCAEMFFLGTISGGVVGHICLAAAEYEDISAQLGLSLLIGVLTGIASITLWCTFGMPCIAILQATLSLGALVASITYFSIPDGIALFENDANFWVVYAAIMIMVPLLLCMFPLSSNIVCCAFVVRRMVVRGFNVATIQPPYQGEDIWLAVIWVMLALFGMSLQRKRLNGRPPFPSPANYTTIRSERSPLLSQVRNGRQVLVLRENDEVYRYSRCCWH
ncbi:transmembrane 7 superfamily member 3 isoform X2 [Diachasma alloeum]|uniref:transmembrane 7 superfamily member 3 isoform X2 n=1 Tax=Diachasma alloeum TaxID=454923 RepID=UPI0007383585|nr:transmembrane 7 superfamily member 3 isoform X2 [Diachasma alloeum]